MINLCFINETILVLRNIVYKRVCSKFDVKNRIKRKEAFSKYLSFSVTLCYGYEIINDIKAQENPLKVDLNVLTDLPGKM